ncbi:hypothetical protein [Hoeflea sp.]|uniref:hypothetical protein n=1 Tax=Hoeflea sp. TaxID=1940281 RepID=UPI003A8DECBD
MYEFRFPVFVDPNTVNFVIASVIAILVLYWMKICFIRPPRFTRYTAGKFFQQSFLYIANGSKEELLVLARELMREIPRIVANSPVRKRVRFGDEEPLAVSKLEGYANNLFLLLSDPRFCDVVAEEIPTFPAYLSEEMVRLERSDAPAHLVIRRIVISLLANPRSALFVENEWLEQGYTGEAKPITRSIFKNWSKLERYEGGVESPLDLDYPHASNWDTDTWNVYFSMAKEYIRGLTSNEYSSSDAPGVRHVLSTTEKAYEQLGDLPKYDNPFDPHNPYYHANAANKFLAYFIKIFDESGERVYFRRNDKYLFGNDLSSKIANLIHNAVYHASGVNTKEFRMWDVQHNLVWSPIQEYEVHDTEIMKMVRRKLRRMIWNEISEMDRFPNYTGARYVRFCLNVLGFYDAKTHRRDKLEKDSWALAKVVSGWVARNYQTIALSHPPVAEAMLPANIEYDPVKEILVRTKDDSLTGIPRVKEFSLEPSRGSVS